MTDLTDKAQRIAYAIQLLKEACADAGVTAAKVEIRGPGNWEHLWQLTPFQEVHRTSPKDLSGNPQSVVEGLIAQLRIKGHDVRASDPFIPGLYRIDGGPELTTGQVISVATEIMNRPGT